MVQNRHTPQEPNHNFEFPGSQEYSWIECVFFAGGVGKVAGLGCGKKSSLSFRWIHVGVSLNGGFPPKSSHFNREFSIINHLF